MRLNESVTETPPGNVYDKKYGVHKSATFSGKPKKKLVGPLDGLSVTALEKTACNAYVSFYHAPA